MFVQRGCNQLRWPTLEATKVATTTRNGTTLMDVERDAALDILSIRNFGTAKL